MRKYIKFYAIAAALLIFSYYMAITNDTFATMLCTLPAFLFFLFSFILSLIKVFRKEKRKYHLIKSVSSLVLTLSLIIPLTLSDRGLSELTKKRIQIIQGVSLHPQSGWPQEAPPRGAFTSGKPPWGY